MKRVMLTLCILLGAVVVYQLRVLALCECRNNLGQCVDCVTPTCPAQYGCTRSSVILWQDYCCCSLQEEPAKQGCCQYYCVKYQCQGTLAICEKAFEVERDCIGDSCMLSTFYCYDDGQCRP